MVKIEGSRRFGALTEERLAEFEHQMSARMPDDYRSFLLQHNGGKPNPDTVDFVLEGEPTSSDLQYLCGIHRGEYWASLTGHVKMFSARIPAGFLPIGYDSGGNQYVLGLEAPHRGRVYFWDHEMEADEGEVPTMENMSLVAESFSSFLEGLREYDDDEE
jgi:hypothetical protein